jgi:hypothetical protein
VGGGENWAELTLTVTTTIVGNRFNNGTDNDWINSSDEYRSGAHHDDLLVCGGLQPSGE